MPVTVTSGPSLTSTDVGTFWIAANQQHGPVDVRTQVARVLDAHDEVQPEIDRDHDVLRARGNADVTRVVVVVEGEARDHHPQHDVASR